MSLAFQDLAWLRPYVVLAEEAAQVTLWANDQGIDPERCTWAADPAVLEIDDCQIVVLWGWYLVPDLDRLPAEDHLDEIQPGWRD